jgi:hypothetical protein
MIGHPEISLEIEPQCPVYIAGSVESGRRRRAEDLEQEVRDSTRLGLKEGGCIRPNCFACAQ